MIMINRGQINMITKDEVLNLLDYHEDSGEFYWRFRDISYFKSERSYKSFCARWAGKKATTKKNPVDSKTSYYFICIKGVTYKAEKIVWLLKYGYIPKILDHIDGNGLNNQIDNLRDVTNAENSKNKSLQKNNKLGISGVRIRHRYKKIIPSWNARISLNGILVDLGLFDDFFEACCARKSAERRYGYHENHGRVFKNG